MATETSTYDLVAMRQQLPALKDVVYMNSGTEGIMAESVKEKFFATLGRFESYGHWGRVELNDQMAICRARVATMINAEPDEVTITRNGTDGVSIVLGSFPLQTGDEIVIGSEEHPAIVYPAFSLQTVRGIVVKRFRFDHDPAQTLTNFKAQLSSRTKLVAFSHVSCETGTRNPAKQIIDASHAAGVPVLLDGAQTFGAIPVDFKALNCDYFTGSAHKWLCGPKGTGILAVRRDRLDSLTPAYIGGGSLSDGFPWAELDNPESVRTVFAPAASKFEYGMRNPAVYAGMIFAIDYLSDIGWDAIAAHERLMSDRLKARLADIPGARVQTPIPWENSSAILNIAIDGVSGKEFSQRLWNDYKIVQRAVRDPDGVRISNAYWTSNEDHDKLIAAIVTIGKR